jgi:hypothetical protein
MALIEHSTNAVSRKVIGAAIEVHRHLGPGLLESSYHACLCHELDLRGIVYRSQVALPVESESRFRAVSVASVSPWYTTCRSSGSVPRRVPGHDVRQE